MSETRSNDSSSQIKRCKGVVCWEAGEAPKVEEIRVEPPQHGEVRIKMLFASLCHTDVLCCRGFPSSLFPRVLGHEGVGMVESVGEGVKDLREGDVVIPTYLGECRHCENCISGKTNLCLTYPLQAFTGLMSDGTSRMWINNIRGDAGNKPIPLYHFLSCSTWSEYTVVDANYVVKIDGSHGGASSSGNLPQQLLPHASFLSCGFSTGFGAAWKEAQVERGSTVAVLGLGAVGLGVVEGARLLGASRIIGIDINDSKREKGMTFGMTDFVNPTATTTTRSSTASGSIPDLVKELTGGVGVDFSFECTGVASLVNLAIEATKVGRGKTIMLGAGTQKSMVINYISLLCGRTFKYSVFGGIRVQSDLPLLLSKCINQEIQNLDVLLTHQVPLQDINTAFELLKQPDCVKILITF